MAVASGGAGRDAAWASRRVREAVSSTACEHAIAMHVLVANIGSTSFKFRLFDMREETELARGGVERVGSKKARRYFVRSGQTDVVEWIGRVRDQGEALAACLEMLEHGDAPVLSDPSQLSAVGFKAVMARGLNGVQRVNKKVLKAMSDWAEIAPAHNPPYISAMRSLRKRFPDLPLVAAFETGFHSDMPAENAAYAVPREWSETYGIRRHGFHGASHRYIAERMRQLTRHDGLRLISCHLGGSSSVSAIAGNRSIANSFGFSPQSGLPHNNRVGDIDPYALLAVKRASGKSYKKLLGELAEQGGLQGLSGIGSDVREIEQAARTGNAAAQMALDVFVASIRHYVGAYLVQLGGADAIAFTGGIGEHSPIVRAAVCREMEWCGVVLDGERNLTAAGEAIVSSESSRVSVWILPTNEELVVARQVVALLGQPARS